MLGDTLVLPHLDGDITLNKISEQDYSSEYMFRDSTHQIIAKVRHSRTKATTVKPSHDRHNFEVVETTFATESAAEANRKYYFVQEQPASDTDVKLANAVCNWAIASSNANLTSLLGWQS